MPPKFREDRLTALDISTGRWAMKRGSIAIFSLLLVTALSSVAYAGPGSVVIKTEGDITATFGGQVRVIPTYEQDWDFGIAGETKKTGQPITSFLLHLTEAGVVNKSYIRSEDRLYFTFAKGDIWDVYMALEFDDVLSSRTTDRVRDVQGIFGSFGLERVSASIKLPWIFSRFYAGWDIYGVDLDGALFIYGDDDPGFWLTGGVGNIDWQFGYHKKDEENRTFQGIRGTPPNITITGADNERDILSARINYTPFKGTKLGLIYTWDHLGIRPTLTPTFLPPPPGDPCGPTVLSPANPKPANNCPEVDSHHIGGIVTAQISWLKLTVEYVHQFGEARKTNVINFNPITGKGSKDGSYDIDANAAFGDLSFDLTPWTGFRLIPHVGVMWASGDDNPRDNKLGGYTGNTDGYRYTTAFGGENTILGDNSNVVGTNLYSAIPNLRGNQNSGLVTGGLVNNSRGDSPGVLLVGGGVTVAPTKNTIYRTNAYYLQYDTKPCVNPTISAPGGVLVTDFPLLTPPSPCDASRNTIQHRDIGVEWDNEVMVWLDKNMVVKGQFSFLFPGDAVKDITQTLTTIVSPTGALISRGKVLDETAIRLGLELLWNF